MSVARYPRDKRLNYRELLPYVRQALPENEPYAIVAESFSGPLALMHAAEQPAQLKAVILCASFVANPLPLRFRWLRVFAYSPVFHIPPPRGLLRTLLIGSDSSAELTELVANTVRSVRPRVLAHRARLILSVRVGHLLRSLKVPLLYVAGSRDCFVGLRGLEQEAPGLHRFARKLQQAVQKPG